MASRGAALAAAAPYPEIDAGEANLRILAAEDNPTNRSVLTALLQAAGLSATFVENGVQAIEAWRNGEWDLILLDVQMPVMDGTAAARAIRTLEAESRRAPTPIIALTANTLFDNQLTIELGRVIHGSRQLAAVPHLADTD